MSVLPCCWAPSKLSRATIPAFGAHGRTYVDGSDGSMPANGVSVPGTVTGGNHGTAGAHDWHGRPINPGVMGTNGWVVE